MGWVKMPDAKIPEEDGATVTYAISQEGDVKLIGFNVQDDLQQDIYNLMTDAREAADEAGEDVRADAFEDAMRLVRKIRPNPRL